MAQNNTTGPGVRSASNPDSNNTTAGTGQAPANAAAAPTAGKENIFTGLCEALNKHQQDLVKAGKRKIADRYAIEFAPNSVGESTVKRPLDQDATTAPMQNNDSTSKLNPAKNQVNKNARTYPIRAGSQIVQVIDNVMRNSSFITGQQNIEISTATDPTTGVQTQKLKAKTGTGNFQWFKISLNAQWLGYDTVIRDHAYQFTFIITPYPVGQMISQYFPDSIYRGVHKSYQYWFTGQNTQVLSYEATYNNLYRIVLTGTGPIIQAQENADFRDLNRKIYMATSENRAAGAKDYANEPGDNAASYFYDPGGLKIARMRIVGDPAWLQQGEVGLGVSAKAFNFSPFNPDGAINYDASAIMFDISFNHPVDYNYTTGIMDVNAFNRNELPLEHYTYTARSIKSFFRKGRFEQELEGALVTEKKASNTQTVARPAATVTSATNTRQSQDTGAGSNVTTISAVSEIQYDESGAPIGTGYLPPTPQPAPPAANPTSNGGVSGAEILNGPPPPAITIQPTTPTLNPNATGQNLGPQASNPQIMDRET